MGKTYDFSVPRLLIVWFPDFEFVVSHTFDCSVPIHLVVVFVAYVFFFFIVGD